jgi:6-phosphogluconate dehydrogenase
LYLGKIVSYAQGFSQLRAASDEYNWDLNYGEIAKIFRAGCIIRAQFLQKITDAYAQNAGIANLCCWRRTSNRSLMTISRRCVMSWLMLCRMVFRYRRSLPQLPTTTATVLQFCRLT